MSKKFREVVMCSVGVGGVGRSISMERNMSGKITVAKSDASKKHGVGGVSKKVFGQITTSYW